MYQIVYRDIAATEYSEAIEWYEKRNMNAAENFIKAIENKLDSISKNPHRYKNLFKKFYETSTAKYPYTIVYLIEEMKQRVLIIAIYHTSRNPRKKYRR